ncbi:hypothetical protein HDU87_004610 [Geranomyces variabilis]|uniref:Uncharacterized protein n=1 Tax=Geranomyces variabilis TaxID=109894 RepID=A0AAD5TIJ5_9FUNG|nr:hypothetical protein HDU87_004610 [Geranomyces variabilis]
MMSMDLDTAASPTARASAATTTTSAINPTVVSAASTSTGPTIKSFSATYAAIFTRPELYTRPQYQTLRAQTPVPLSRTPTGLSDTPSTVSSSSSSPLVSSPWQAAAHNGSDRVVDNVAAFFSRSTLAEPQEGLWDMDEERQHQPDHELAAFRFDKSPARSDTIPIVPPIFTRSVSDSSAIAGRAVKKIAPRIRKAGSVESNQITNYFKKSSVSVALAPKPANVVANASRCQSKPTGTLLGLQIIKPVRQQKRKSKDLCSTPVVPAREDKMIRTKNRRSAVTSPASTTSYTTSTTRFSTFNAGRSSSSSTRPARPTLCRTVTVGTYSSWSRKATPAAPIISRPIPRPALPIHAATVDGTHSFASMDHHDSTHEDGFASMSSDDDDDDSDSAILDASPTRVIRPRYARSATVPIITVCSPPRRRKSSVPMLSSQDDLYHCDNLRTPSPARRPARHAASAAAAAAGPNTASSSSSSSQPIDVPSRKNRLMKPMPMGLITGKSVAASPDSLNLIAALQCGYTAAAFKCPDRNPFL